MMKSIIPVKESMLRISDADNILASLKEKYHLTETELVFLKVYCTTFNIADVCKILKISKSEALSLKIALQPVIVDYIIPLFERLKEVFVVELIKALRQDKSDYLKAQALNLVAKMQEYVSDQPQVNITIMQREELLQEARRLVGELREE